MKKLLLTAIKEFAWILKKEKWDFVFIFSCLLDCYANLNAKNWQKNYWMIYTELYNINQIQLDRRTKKLDLYQNYKFVIVFENAIETDYVTEIFFDTLLAGSVPVYWLNYAGR